MRSLGFIFLFIILISGSGWAENKIDEKSEQKELRNLLPPAQKGWTVKEEASFFTRENLFDYINGGAELYLSYDFRKLLVQEFSSGEAPVLVEIYEMKSSEDAYGLFSLNQEGESLPMGQGASYGFGLLSLWKDHYFVRIIDMDGGAVTEDIILNLGKEVAERIENEGEIPELLIRISRENLLTQSLYYFHKNIVLNNLYFLSKENILNLSEETDAVLVSYKFDKEIMRLLLVQYPDTTESKKAFQSFNEHHLKATISSLRHLQKLGEDLFSGIELKDRFLIVVLEGKTKGSVDKLLTVTKQSLEQ